MTIVSNNKVSLQFLFSPWPIRPSEISHRGFPMTYLDYDVVWEILWHLTSQEELVTHIVVHDFSGNRKLVERKYPYMTVSQLLIFGDKGGLYCPKLNRVRAYPWNYDIITARKHNFLEGRLHFDAHSSSWLSKGFGIHCGKRKWRLRGTIIPNK